jgi:hypothetical protein
MRLVPALIVTLSMLPLVADTTGRISGKITSKDGKPVPSAKVLLKRVDTNWSKDLKVNDKGAYLQVGLDPKEFDIQVTAEGFAPHSERVKVPLGDGLIKDIVLLTPTDARTSDVAAGKTVVIDDPGASLDSAGSDAFNQAVTLFNEKKFNEALPMVELAYQNLVESAEKTVNEKAKAEVLQKLPTVERTYAVALFEVGDSSETKRGLLEKAKPLLEKTLAANPKDIRCLDALVRIAKTQKNAEAEKKYQALLDAVLPPRPEAAYNLGVAAYNNNHMKEAKEHFLRAIAIDPKFPDTYFLLGMVEYGGNPPNLKGTKANLQKYLELAPNGKEAGMARDMLSDPSLKNIK